MSELLTESFCERCGTRYTFESGEPDTTRPSVKKARVLARGLKHFVLSDDSLETALAEGERDEDRERAELQLEAFHQTFNFCMDCRQYTCRDCWNETEGRCLSCAPAPGRIESAVAWGQTELDSGSRLDALLGAGVAKPPIDAWPLAPGIAPEVSDLGAAPSLEERVATDGPAAIEPWSSAHEPPAQPAPIDETAVEPEPWPAEEPVAADGPATETHWAMVPDAPLLPEAAIVPDIAPHAPEPEAISADETEAELEAELEAPRPQSLEDYLLAASAARAAALAAAGPEPTPEVLPEPEAVAATDAAPEPVAAPAPAAQPELVAEPVVQIAAEAAPASAAPAAAEPEAVAGPEPASPPPPAIQAPPPAPPAPRPIFPPPVGGDARPTPSTTPGWNIVAPDAGHPQPPPLPPAPAPTEARPAGWFAARTNATIWEASSVDVVNRPGVGPGAGVQACVSCGLPLSAVAHFCRRCGARQAV